jgi:hypothetical protein
LNGGYEEMLTELDGRPRSPLSFGAGNGFGGATGASWGGWQALATVSARLPGTDGSPTTAEPIRSPKIIVICDGIPVTTSLVSASFSAPEDSGGVLVHFRQEPGDASGAWILFKQVPPFVPVPPVKGPVVLILIVPELGNHMVDEQFSPKRHDISGIPSDLKTLPWHQGQRRDRLEGGGRNLAYQILIVLHGSYLTNPMDNSNPINYNTWMEAERAIESGVAEMYANQMFPDDGYPRRDPATEFEIDLI